MRPEIVRLLAISALLFSFDSLYAASSPIQTLQSLEAKFGKSIAYTFPWLVVGAPDAADSANNQGKVLVYKENFSGEFELTQTLSAQELGLSEQTDLAFGAAIAIEERVEHFVLAVGAPGHLGGVFIYTVSEDENDTWLYRQTIPGGQGVGFGKSIDLLETRLIVGAPGYNYYDVPSAGRAYVYATLTSPDELPYYEYHHTIYQGNLYLGNPAVPYAEFGRSVAIGFAPGPAPGGFIYAIGAPGDVTLSTKSGSVNLYSESYPSPYDPQPVLYVTKVSHYSQQNGDLYGQSVDMDRDLLIVGAPGDNGNGELTTNAGRAYIYKAYLNQYPTLLVGWYAREGNTSREQTYAAFGTAVAIKAEPTGALHYTAVAGAPYMDVSGTNNGAAFIHRSGWVSDYRQINNPTAPARSEEGQAVTVLYARNQFATGSPGGKRAHIYN